MLSLVKHVYVEYHLYIVKMHVESSKSEIALKNLNSLCDFGFIFKLLFIILMLEMCVHVFIKIAQIKDVFACGFVEFLKLV
jgi:hypothetical protein